MVFKTTAIDHSAIPPQAKYHTASGVRKPFREALGAWLKESKFIDSKSLTARWDEGNLPLIRQLSSVLFAVAGVEANGAPVMDQHDVQVPFSLPESATVCGGRPQDDRWERHPSGY